MSSIVINSFRKYYSETVLRVCKKNNIEFIPYPVSVINTDKDIIDYQTRLNNYIHKCEIKQDGLVFKKVSDKFPQQYFNYEC